ncbi:hypothetical protein [Parvicella tangerina]|uniref:Uncharacterized protein n=1 Tax=Parvicella tangerina TaxID=2829795 RepID=A0A916JL59_9FLAO|nr:hypothetical protein [Parvicella tangerina]CAG5079900.1 hypothetical protein CRYO30217_01113 [Parvicella tangerina]
MKDIQNRINKLREKLSTDNDIYSRTLTIFDIEIEKLKLQIKKIQIRKERFRKTYKK